MVASAVELADLLVQILRLSRVFVVMDEAASLRPNALEEAPKAANQTDLEAHCAQSFLVGVSHGVVWLHRLAPVS